jgi:Xaa-Pro aminopeptidase
MFQTFEVTSQPEFGPERLKHLREKLTKAGVDGFIVPRADIHQGEYVAPADERLKWLTGFTGSAGFCIVLPHIAGVFIDGRYRTQIKSQVDLAHFTPVPWPEIKPGDWLADQMPNGGKIAFDPWLHTAREIADLEERLQGTGITLAESKNYVDSIWQDRPAPPSGIVSIHPLELAGESSSSKRARLGDELRKAGQKAVVLTLPDSISWLFNIRGSDVARNPVVQALAILHADGKAELFIDPAKITDPLVSHLGSWVQLQHTDSFEPALLALQGPVRVDRGTAPFKVSRILKSANIEVVWGTDPCLLPKACKNATEIAGMTEAHLRDGAAMVEFLCWLDHEAPKGTLTEIDVVRALEGFRRATNVLKEISFETICGTGPNGAIMHYRVSEVTNQPLREGEIVVVDSGGQYIDGTTDITRTVAIGPAADEVRACFTRVLQGMIAISRLRWPKGLAGSHLDALARYPLWLAHQDYDHGTGHGVGAYLSVHEGPAGLSRRYDVPLDAGMILSNEPGYYREGAFGIRIENLVVVEAATPPGTGDTSREMLTMRTLTYVPIDRRLIAAQMLTRAEVDWIDSYHAEVLAKIGPRVSEKALDWLKAACVAL